MLGLPRALLPMCIAYRLAATVDTSIGLGSYIMEAFQLPSPSITSISSNSDPPLTSSTSFSASTSTSTLVFTITGPAVVTVIIDPGFGVIGANTTHSINGNLSVGLSSSGSAPRQTMMPTTENGCGFGQINQENWIRDDVDTWLSSWWDGKTNFTLHLKETFAPNVADSSFTCNVFQQCTVRHSLINHNNAY